jgi:hypothetical protein
LTRGFAFKKYQKFTAKNIAVKVNIETAPISDIFISSYLRSANFGLLGILQSKLCTNKEQKLFCWTGAARAVQSGNFGADDRVIFRLFVEFQPISILGRQRHVRVNSFYGTFRQASIAVNTIIGINIKTIW